MEQSAKGLQIPGIDLSALGQPLLQVYVVQDGDDQEHKLCIKVEYPMKKSSNSQEHHIDKSSSEPHHRVRDISIADALSATGSHSDDEASKTWTAISEELDELAASFQNEGSQKHTIGNTPPNDGFNLMRQGVGNKDWIGKVNHERIVKREIARTIRLEHGKEMKKHENDLFNDTWTHFSSQHMEVATKERRTKNDICKMNTIHSVTRRGSGRDRLNEESVERRMQRDEAENSRRARQAKWMELEEDEENSLLYDGSGCTDEDEKVPSSIHLHVPLYPKEAVENETRKKGVDVSATNGTSKSIRDCDRSFEEDTKGESEETASRASRQSWKKRTFRPPTKPKAKSKTERGKASIAGALSSDFYELKKALFDRPKLEERNKAETINQGLRKRAINRTKKLYEAHKAMNVCTCGSKAYGYDDA